MSANGNISRCVCGAVELETSGAPIWSIACHCDDCQQGSAQIEQLPGAESFLDSGGGTAYLLVRKDRMTYRKGKELLRDYRLKESSPTRRVVATCCNSFMFLEYQKGHWYSMRRERFGADAPALQMRVQTQFKPERGRIPKDAPQYSSYPIRLIAKLMLARVGMLF